MDSYHWQGEGNKGNNYIMCALSVPPGIFRGFWQGTAGFPCLEGPVSFPLVRPLFELPSFPVPLTVFGASDKGADRRQTARK